MIEYYYAELTLIAVILKSDVFAEEPYVTRLHAFSKEIGHMETEALCNYQAAV